jgi:hypothetical protein
VRNLESFYKNMCALLDSIEDTLAKQRILPCLTLVYSGIDVVASLEARDQEGVRSSFTRWVDDYLLKAGSFEFNALDLYAARCAVVHTFTPESDLSRSGKARTISYAWGTADVNRLGKASAILNRSDMVHVHVNDLVKAFRSAIANYMDAVEADPSRQKAIEQAAGLWYVEMEPGPVEKLIEAHERALSYSPGTE